MSDLTIDAPRQRDIARAGRLLFGAGLVLLVLALTLNFALASVRGKGQLV